MASSGPSELASGHLAPPSTPFHAAFLGDMASESVHSTRPTSPTIANDAGRLDPVSRADTMETYDCTQPNQTRPKKKKDKQKQKRDDSAISVWQPVLTLENSGSVARDHLASERTFLAYVRTSLAIASTGVALVQLFTISAATTNKAMERYSRPIGAVVICIGLATLLLGLVRYFTIQVALVGGNFPVARVSPILLAMLMSAVVVVVFGVIIGAR